VKPDAKLTAAMVLAGESIGNVRCRSDSMNQGLVIIVATLLMLGTQSIIARQTAAEAERLLASAHHKATINGDLTGAIEEYKKVVAAAGSNRVLAAQALLRMAECHQKLGDTAARAIYERLVRDYADQKDAAAMARTRLGTLEPAVPVKGDRSVWTAEQTDGFGTISPDGRFLTFADWGAGAALTLRDLSAGTNHRLTAGGQTQFSAISKDGQYVAYQWIDANAPIDARGYELRVARLQGTSISEPRVLVNNHELNGAAPFDWSPDGKWIAVGIGRRDSTRQIALVNAQDGAVRVLKSLDWKEPTKIFFSPDGRFIAYDLMVSDTGTARQVFVMAVDGSRETVVEAHPSQNAIMGWSPDGRYVLFSSDRSGSFGLWAVPVSDGKAAGSATLIKPDIASSWSLGLTTSGTMYVWKTASPVFIQASSIDLAAGKLVPAAPTFQRFIQSRGRPDWSADGKQLAYQSCDPLGAGPCALWIRSVDTGQLREVKVKLHYFFYPRWSPDGRELLVRATDLRGRNNGLYRIDVHSGEATVIVTPYPGESLPSWGPDGKHAYYRRGLFLIERHLESGVEREAVRLPANASRDVALSPDGRHLAYILRDGEATDMFVVPLAGGAAKSVFRVMAPERLMFRFDWTADGQALALVKERTDVGKRELWLVPFTGEHARKLDVDIDNWLVGDGFRLDRAGKQIAFVAAAGQPGTEIRALENFLPELARLTTKK
jgi:Tol biopolymer transport system component